MNLYWCSTKEHDDDWFVIANNKAEGIKVWGMNEYAASEVDAARIVNVSTITGSPRIATNDDLVRLGATVRQDPNQPRVVQLNNHTYVEGALDSEIAKAQRHTKEVKDDGFVITNATPFSRTLNE